MTADPGAGELLEIIRTAQRALGAARRRLEAHDVDNGQMRLDEAVTSTHPSPDPTGSTPNGTHPHR